MKWERRRRREREKIEELRKRFERERVFGFVFLSPRHHLYMTQTKKETKQQKKMMK